PARTNFHHIVGLMAALFSVAEGALPVRMRYLIVAALAAAFVLTVRWQWAGHGDFEDAVARASVVEELRRDGSHCPLSDREIGRAPQWVLSACASGGLGWHEAA